jgi:hypothetical protein
MTISSDEIRRSHHKRKGASIARFEYTRTISRRYSGVVADVVAASPRTLLILRSLRQLCP